MDLRDKIKKDLKDLPPSVELYEILLKEIQDSGMYPSKKEGILELVTFFKDPLILAPASRRYHECFPGGLLLHILHFYCCGLVVSQSWPDVLHPSILTVAILHDFSKIGDDLMRPRYIEDPSGKAPYIINPEYFDGNKLDDGIGSLRILDQQRPNLYSVLTEEEIHAIQFHDLGWNRAINSQLKIPALTILCHAADMLSSRGHFP